MHLEKSKLLYISTVHFWLIDWFESIIMYYKIHKVFFCLTLLCASGGWIRWRLGWNDNVDTLMMATKSYRLSINNFQSVSVFTLSPVFCMAIFSLADLFNLWGFIHLIYVCERIFIHKNDTSFNKINAFHSTSRFWCDKSDAVERTWWNGHEVQ